MDDSLLAGVAAMSKLLSRTLGPSAAPVLSGGASLELLADSAMLARRITGLAGVGRAHNAGALLVGELARTVRETYGDGAATAAVLAGVMVGQAGRLVNAGVQPVDLRRGIDRGVDAACRSLATQATEVGLEEARGLFDAAVHDAALGALLAEMFDLLGEHPALLIEERDRLVPSVAGPLVDHEYVDGARWRARPADGGWLPEGKSELTLREPLIVVVDGVLRQADDVVPVLDLAHREGRPLLLVSRDVEADASRILLAMRTQPGAPLVAPWCLASAGTRVGDDLEDLAVLTGASVLTAVLGRHPGTVRSADCGSARHVSLTRAQLTVSESAGDPADRIETLSARLQRTPAGHETNALRLRLARLAGSLGVVTITGGPDPERALYRARIENGQRVFESARAGGVVGGGGTAYLRCRPDVLSARAECGTEDQRCGVDVVLAALEAPFRQLVRSHGSESPSVAVEKLAELGDGWGFDASEGSYVDVRASGLVDSAGVAEGALRSAGSLAGAVITTTLVAAGGARG